jgi:hypothetical protein
MGDQPSSWHELFDQLLPEPEVADLAQRIGSKLPPADFRRAITNVVAFAIGVAASNQRPWQQQKEGLKEVSKRARKAAAAVRELDKALDDGRWVHNRQQLMNAVGWSGADLLALAAQLENLALPAKAMAGMREIPRNEVFTIFVQLVAPVFTTATGIRPSITYDPIGGRYTGPFIDLVENIWGKILAIGEAVGSAIEGPHGNNAIGKAAQRLKDKL